LDRDDWPFRTRCTRAATSGCLEPAFPSRRQWLDAASRASREGEGGSWHAAPGGGLYGRPGEGADQVVAKKRSVIRRKPGRAVWG